MPGPVFRHDRFGLEAHLQKQGIFIPRTGSQLQKYAEGVAVLGLGIIVLEIIEHFLDAHRVGGRRFARQEHGTQLSVGRGVHVGGEGGKGRNGHALEAVLPDIGVLVSIPIVAVSQPSARPKGGGHGSGHGGHHVIRAAFLRLFIVFHLCDGVVLFCVFAEQGLQGEPVPHAGDQQAVIPLEGHEGVFRGFVKNAVGVARQIR